VHFNSKVALRHHSLICSKSNVNNLNCMDVLAPQKQAQVVTDVKNVEKEYKCLECGKIFLKYRNFYDHKKRHEGIIYRCTHCPATYKSISGLRKHTRTQHNLRLFENKYCCNECRAEFRTRSRFECHLRTQHKMNHLECYYCAKILETKMSLILHMVTHTKKIQCNECSAMFKNHYKLEKHLKEIHFLEGCHKCPHCLIVLNTESCLNNHMVTHLSSNDTIVTLPLRQKIF
jgi:DNA-directed RNA polymerase subunit RPC12/RpoP